MLFDNFFPGRHGLCPRAGSIDSAPSAWVGLRCPTRQTPRGQTPSPAARGSANQNTARPPRPQPRVSGAGWNPSGRSVMIAPRCSISAQSFLFSLGSTMSVLFFSMSTVRPAGSILAAEPTRILTRLSSQPAGTGHAFRRLREPRGRRGDLIRWHLASSRARKRRARRQNGRALRVAGSLG